MKQRTKILYFAIAASFPLMMSFQNCAKNAGQMQGAADSSSTVTPKSVAAPVNSDKLPFNQVISFDESNNRVASVTDSSSKGSDDVRIQIEDPAIEHQKDIDMAIEKCNALPQPGAVDPANTAQIDVSGLRGVRILSPADFNGRSDVKSLSNSYGTLVLCGLDIDEVYKTGGKIIAIDTHINKITSHFGNIDLVDSSVIVDASNIKIFRVLSRQPDISVAQ